jgi:hypothetical protein
MTIQLSSLRVSPEIDAAKYTAGAQQKVAADKAMAASSRDVAQAMAANDAKISTGGDVLARLSRQYVEGYTAQQRFATGLGQLSRGLETGKVSMESAERILVGMNQKLGLSADFSELAAKGQTQLAAAVRAANLQIEGQALAAERARVAQSRLAAANVNTRPNNNFAALNATNQFQDIAITAAMGQSISTIALQQGTQLGMAMQMSVGEQGATGAVKMLGSAIMGLFSPINLVSIGITAAAAATIQWFMEGEEGAESLEKTLQGHSKTLAILKDQYGALGEAVKGVGTVGGVEFARAMTRQDITLLAAQAREQNDAVMHALTSNKVGLGGNSSATGLMEAQKGNLEAYGGAIETLLRNVREGHGDLAAFNKDVDNIYRKLADNPGDADPLDLKAAAESAKLLADNAFNVTTKFAPFAAQINQVNASLAAGVVPDLAAINAEIRKIGQEKGIGKLADEAIVAQAPLVDVISKLREIERIRDRIEANQRGPLINSSDEDDRNDYEGNIRVAMDNARRNAEAAEINARARTNAEKLEAARRSAELQRNPGETPQQRDQRIDIAVEAERTRQFVAQRDAIDDRHRSQVRSIEAAKEEMSLVGATVGETTRLNYQYAGLARLKEEAAKTGGIVSEDEVRRIKETAAELGRIADARARLNLNLDLQFEYQQAFRSPLEQQIASRLRGTGLGMDSPEAGQMREIQRINDLRAGVKGFFDDFQAGLLRGDSFGKSLGNAILNALNKALDKIIESGVDALVNAIVGGQGGSSGGGLLGALFGSAASSFGTKSGFADMLGIGAANDNYAPGAITRSALPDIGSITSSVGGSYSVANATSFIQQYASAIGIDPGVALRVARSEGLGAGIWQSNLFRNGVREPSFGPFQLLKGGSGTGFGAGLGNRFMEQTGLDPANPANWRQSTAFALDQAKANGWGAWFGAKNAGIGTWEGIDRSATKAVGALDKLSTGSTKAISGIANLGQAGNQATQGLSTFGSALNKFPAAPSGGGGGGIGGFFSSLFGGGGLNSAFSGTAAFSWLSANPGGYIGLFHEGGTAGNATRFRGGVDMNIFQHAPRYHNGGIANDEVPAILKRGEPVFKSMEHARQVVGGSNVNVVINNNAGVAVQTQERREADGSISIDVMLDRVVAEKLGTRGTAANSILRGEFGAQKVLKGR